MELRVAAGAAAPPRAMPVLAGTSADLDALMDARATLLETPDEENNTWSDIRRICALPVRAPLTMEETDFFSARYALQESYRRGFRLRPLQAQALCDYEMEGGLLAPIGVGGGKTLISVCIAHRAYKSGHRTVMVLVPSPTLLGFAQQLPLIRSWVPVGVPIHIVQGPQPKRAAVYRSKMAGCYVVPYSLLSTEDASEMLHAIDPSVIVMDELHRLKHGDAARTRRVTKFLKEKKWRVEIAAMSGSLTSRSVKDYAHVAWWALGNKAPVPTTYHTLVHLCSTIDSGAEPSSYQRKLWQPLRTWCRLWFPNEELSFDDTGIRRAFQLRLRSAPGVVSSTEEDQLDVPLKIHPRPVLDAAERPGYAEVLRLIEQVEKFGTAPNGDAIDHAIHNHKWLRELTMGFYNSLEWPEPDVVARRAGVALDDAKRLLSRALEHHMLLQAYHKELRDWLKSHRIDKMDTPRLVGMSMHRNGDKFVGKKLFASWKAAKDLDADDLPRREARPVRLCDYKINDSLRWADSHRDGGILWVYSIEVGRWMFEALRGAGFSNALHCPAGAHAEILDPGNRDKLLVASMGSHGEGKNLQHHQNTRFVEWPREALLAQQVLGRTHRPGQEADELHADCCDTTDYDDQARAAGLIDALYQQQTTGVPMKVITAEYDPLPSLMPSAVLRERGFENALLSEYEELLLREKFRGLDDS